MSKKTKNVGLDSTLPYAVGGCEDAKARLKHQSLMQDFQELQKEVDVMRSKLEAEKQRKTILAAEVRFLRRRYEYFMKTKALNSSQKGNPVLKQAKHVNESRRKEASQHILPPKPKAKSKKKKHYISKEVAISGKTLHGRREASDLHHKGRVDAKKKMNTTPALDLNQNERLHANDNALRNTFVAFDLNQDNSSSGKEVPLPSRAPIFDLNEISTGDEDYQSNMEAAKFEEARRSLTRHPNDEVQNDLMLSVCRNAGEGPSRVGKRKISWQDPVALRV